MFARTVVTLLFITTLTSNGENILTNTITFRWEIEVGKKKFTQHWCKTGIAQGRKRPDLTLFVEQESANKCHAILFGSDDCDDNIPLNMFTIGNRTWEESLTLKAPPEEATAFCSVPIVGMESCGNAFWVKTNCDGYVLCRISGVYPKNLATLKVGEYVKVMIEWVDASNDKSLVSLLPEGWRFPTEDDFGIDEDMLRYRNYMHECIQSPFYHVGADFNGDCVVDHACWLINSDNTMNAIMIILSDDNQKYSIYNYYTGGFPLYSNMYLSYCPPGIKDSYSETEKLKTQNHAFNWNSFESSSNIVYYDSEIKRFVNWQESD
ncbi:MAG: hypothetical protein Q8N51_01125 [Gammaproteobacteria bacterium]|nr:hypothetical protein [Gammaproteobacteria bacterium]